jgi:WXXGXW repeat (2 copies)
LAYKNSRERASHAEKLMLSKSWRLVPALLLMFLPAFVSAQVSVSVSIAPPELPVYDQPPLPGDGYVWTPGYWAWGDDIQDYYWVPGTWIEAPQPDYLWTPGYWAADGGVFLWHAGYWGPQVGFYGGVNYGFGYGGRGYEGGYWQGGHLFYNRAVVNIGSTRVTNVYNKRVVNNITTTRVSFNGGNGGVRAQPNAAETAAGRDRHIESTPAQRDHAQTARGNPALRAATNHGRPPVAATPRAGNFSNPVPARNATVPTRNATVGAERAVGTDRPAGSERAVPQPRLSTPRQAPENTGPAARAVPQERAIQPREAAPPRPAAPPPPPRPPAQVVEPRREAEHTEVAKPAPKAQVRPAPHAPEPAQHPAEHPEEHEHH